MAHDHTIREAAPLIESHPHALVDYPQPVLPGLAGGTASGVVHSAPTVDTARLAPHHRVQQPWARAVKRTMDLAGAIPLALFAAALIPLLAIAVRLQSPGRALFAQQRVGRDGRTIKVYKIRSMYVDAEARLREDPELYRSYVENDFKLPRGTDPRITPIGRILRRTSLDELPQVFSVLRGTMSLVGPRPVVPAELHTLYGDGAPIYLATKPGLTGLWQVSGRSNLRRSRRTSLDFTYVEEWSPVLDVRLLLRTIPALLTGRGAH